MNPVNSKKQNGSDFIIFEEMKKNNIPYESLIPLEPAIDTVSMFQKFKEILNDKNSDWTQQIGVINYLRRVNKFEKSTFNQFFFGSKIYQKIIELINSVRSSVSKNILVLLHEIFSEKTLDNKNSIITLVQFSLPYLITKVNSNQSFIKTESKTCLESIITNLKYFDILLIILQMLTNYKNNKNKDKDIELLCDLSVKMINNLGKEALTESAQFSELIKSVVTFHELDKNKNVKISKNIIDSLVKVMTEEIFHNKIEKCGCTKKEKDIVQKIMKTKVDDLTKKRGTVSSLHFRKNIHERQKSFRLSKCFNKSFDKGKKTVSIKINGKKNDGMINNTKVVVIKNDENIQINN